jgi:5-methylthioadenosine/S-adenosylhomocysteine deaminase
VLTLGARTPNHPRADVLVEDGRIVEVGPGLRARDAEVIDATDTIVMPGFVDAHRHTWKTLHRNLDGDSPLAEHHRPDDVYAAVLLGLLSAAETGITTVVDWLDLPAEHTEAALQAHADTGLRVVAVTTHLDASGGTSTLAYGGPSWREARERDLRIHAHVSGPDALKDLALGPDVTLVGCADLSKTDLDAITAHGAHVVLNPSTSMAAGHGLPPLQELIDHGIRPGLGVEDELLAPGDLFAQMRAAQSAQHATVFDRKLAGKSGLPNLLSTREVIRYATIDGARAIGLGDITGSLEPGKQADLVLLRTDRPNISPVNDPIGAVVWGMDPSNIDWVIVGGRVVVRDGHLVADVTRVRELALAARQRVAAAAGEPARSRGSR